jgi:hypothetical protein
VVSIANFTQSGVHSIIEAALLVRGGTAPQRASEKAIAAGNGATEHVPSEDVWPRMHADLLAADGVEMWLLVGSLDGLPVLVPCQSRRGPLTCGSLIGSGGA